MAKNKISEWSATASNNTDVGNIDIAEGCAPSGINNAIREIMAQVKDMQTGADGDNFAVGGNLSVTGTTTATGAITATGGVVGNVTGNLTGNASTATSATSATTATNIAGGGAGQVPYNSGADTTAFLAAGTSGQFLKSNGTSAPSWGDVYALTSDTAQASTSGTVIDFTGIPSWVKRITLMFSGVSTNGTSPVLVQIGTSSGVENTNYLGASSSFGTGVLSTNFSSGFLISFGTNEAATLVRHGSLVLSAVGSNIWTCIGGVGDSSSARLSITQGAKTLSNVLTQLRVTTVNGTDAFDAGSINIMYE
jgi:hypothetical protein